MNQNKHEEFARFYCLYFESFIPHIIRQYGVSREEAMDLVSDAFLLLLQKWDEIRNHDHSVLSKWILTTIRNLHVQAIRKKNGFSTISLEQDLSERDLIKEQLHTEEPVDPELEEQRFHTALDQMSACLNEREQQVFQYKIKQHMTDCEIAMRMNTTPVAIMHIWRRIQKKVKKNWEQLF